MCSHGCLPCGTEAGLYCFSRSSRSHVAEPEQAPMRSPRSRSSPSSPSSPSLPARAPDSGSGADDTVQALTLLSCVLAACLLAALLAYPLMRFLQKRGRLTLSKRGGTAGTSDAGA